MVKESKHLNTSYSKAFLSFEHNEAVYVQL